MATKTTMKTLREIDAVCRAAETSGQAAQAEGSAPDRTTIIRGLNDHLRQTFCSGWVHLTPGVATLPVDDRRTVMEAVRSFGSFTPANDPYGEHDFGAIKLRDRQLFWKIDAYDLDLQYGSPDPTDPEVTTRVLTIMLAEEY